MSALAGYAFAVENVRHGPSSRDGFAFAVESVRQGGGAASREAVTLAVETVVVPTNPGLIYMSNKDTGAYERYPWYYWDAGSGTWKQAF